MSQSKEKLELSGMIIPQQDIPLLVPHAAVIDILGYQELAASPIPVPWLLGLFTWRRLELPLISMEKMLHLEKTGGGGRARKRIIVIHVFSKKLSVPFIGIEARGMPRLAHLKPDSIAFSFENRKEPDWPISDVINVHDTKSLVLDLDKLGKKISELHLQG